MFKKLFNLPNVLSRYKNAPFSEEQERYLLHCEQQGYAQTTLHVMANDLYWVARKLSVYPDLIVTPKQIKEAARSWSEREHHFGHKLSKQWTRARFIRVATKWLRFLGRLREPVDRSPFSKVIADFSRWLEYERGLLATTINGWCSCLKEFLHWYSTKKRPISTIKVTDVDEFLKYCGRKKNSRITINNKATGLRAFFRYAGKKGLCDPLISETIKGPRIFSEENLPSGPSWKDVRRLIDSMKTDKSVDIRNLPIIMLFAIYGLRVMEVAKLKLEDIDWENDLISVSRSKGRRHQIYPLSPIVGNAILKYLQEVRPKCQWRKVFLTFSTPVRPISRGGLYSIVQRSMLALGISNPRMGPHSLRHACASHLVDKGFSIKEIGDHLGHRSSSATRIYAKVDLPALREVAKFDLGGLI